MNFSLPLGFLYGCMCVICKSSVVVKALLSVIKTNVVRMSERDGEEFSTQHDSAQFSNSESFFWMLEEGRCSFVFRFLNNVNNLVLLELQRNIHLR